MKLSNILAVVSFSCAVLGSSVSRAAEENPEPADIVIRDAKVITVNSKFKVEQAIAIKGDRILALGKTKDISRYIGVSTRVIEGKGKTVMPGLYDSHVHSYNAAVSEYAAPLEAFESISGALGYIRKQAAEKATNQWIILERVYPTRLKEGRLPTLAELDEAAPKHPVYWNCGPVSMANSKALEISGITRDTPNPPSGEIVKNPKTLKLTGLLRNAAHLLKIPANAKPPTPAQRREAVKNLYRLYNEQGITSIGERRAEPAAIDLFRDLNAKGELSVRINCTRVIELGTNIDESIIRLDAMTNGGAGKLPYGPTGVGDDFVRIGPLKTFMDGGMLIGTAYMRAPWGIGPTYQISEPSYRGLLYPSPEILPELYLAAAERGWQLTAHCAGDAAMDMLLNTYEYIQIKTNITRKRFGITHANFQTDQNWARCKALNVCADLQPAWLYEDAESLTKTLGEKRMNYFLPLKTWFDEGIVIGGGSDHMVRVDSLKSTNPWNPCLRMRITLARMTESGRVINPEERLSREQAIRFYTINNAYLNFEEEKKGSLELDKFADLIIIDRDILTCPINEVRGTKVLMTMLGGKIVFEAKNEVAKNEKVK